MESIPHIVVIGAGVVGLTTALKILEAGYQVTILAEIFPGDAKSIRYTSHWAGAHHVGNKGYDSERDKWIDQETYKILWDLSEGEAKDGLMKIPQTEYSNDPPPDMHAWEWLQDYKKLESSKYALACQFTQITIDTPVYLLWLLAKFLAGGGRTKVANLQHISQASEGAHAPKADAVIVCAGLGARFLGGVEDKDVFPVRGQTVRIHAPWIRFGRMTRSQNDGEPAYIIPRKSGDVILGGIRIPDDWHPVPRRETTIAILERCLALCPELVKDKKKEHATVEDLLPLILEEGCGLRPARKGGIRIERETMTNVDGRKVVVVHNYGHGGNGYQASWGSAILTVNLLKEAVPLSSEPSPS